MALSGSVFDFVAPRQVVAEESHRQYQAADVSVIVLLELDRSDRMITPHIHKSENWLAGAAGISAQWHCRIPCIEAWFAHCADVCSSRTPQVLSLRNSSVSGNGAMRKQWRFLSGLSREPTRLACKAS